MQRVMGLVEPSALTRPVREMQDRDSADRSGYCGVEDTRAHVRAGALRSERQIASRRQHNGSSGSFFVLNHSAPIRPLRDWLP